MQIPDEIVEKTWKEVAAYSADRMARESKEFSKKQPFLVTYVLASCDDLGQGAKELAMYLTFVVYRMFAAVMDIPRKIPDKIIEHLSDKNLKMLENLAGENYLEEIARFPKIYDQEHVFRYLTETLSEPDDDEIKLTEEEEGRLFITLKTVVDCLDLVAKK